MIFANEQIITAFKKYNVIVENNASFNENSILGKNSKIYSTGGLDSSIIGSYSYTRSHLVGLILGNYCSIAANVDVRLLPHPLNRITTSPCTMTVSDEDQLFDKFLNKKNFIIEEKIRIEHDVWIGAHAKIMPGITIGTGAVVGAGAIVTHNVPPYAIVAGIPARIIRYRFDEKTRNRLLKSKWFLYDWAGVDVPIGEDAITAVSQMEHYIEKQPPPLLNQACFIQVNENGTCSIGSIKMKDIHID